MQGILPAAGVRKEAPGFRSEQKRTGTAPEACGDCPSRAACPASAPPAISGTLMIRRSPRRPSVRVALANLAAGLFWVVYGVVSTAPDPLGLGPPRTCRVVFDTRGLALHRRCGLGPKSFPVFLLSLWYPHVASHTPEGISVRVSIASRDWPVFAPTAWARPLQGGGPPTPRGFTPVEILYLGNRNVPMPHIDDFFDRVFI